MPRTRKQTKPKGFYLALENNLDESVDAEEKIPATSTKLRNFEMVEKELIISSGKFGRCNVSADIICPQRYPAETTEMFEKVLCKPCAFSIYGEDAVEEAVFHPSDATFKCPVYELHGESCQSKTVTYREFFTGSCCEPASRWLTKNEKGQKEKLKVVEKLCNKSKIDLKNAKEDSERLSKEKKEEERRIISNEKQVEYLKKSIEQSKKKVVEKSHEIGVLKKRVRNLDEDYDLASKRMNLLSFEYFDVAKKEKIKRQNDDSNRCPVCLEDFSKTGSSQKSTLRCGHSACHSCFITILRNSEYDDYDGNLKGQCPKCRSYFTLGNIIRLYD
ncbi:unnamed protein product [Oikopleura dioica]|uniref:RING-type domain-containing protein n=1 Tax=Oikopleura dioica TaxID=34765 RepID=E4WYG1_OIKDI|nr:unnamed protein product [Oikopleura dioica]